MKITYTGKQHELMPPQQQKLDVKFSKLSKLLDRRGEEKEAHVILTSERHLHNAEITVQFYDHPIVGVGSDADLFTAVTVAIDNAEKQILKHQTKWRDTKRTGNGKETWEEETAPESQRTVAAEVEDSTGAGKKVYRVNHHNKRKPMTLEEALIEMERDKDYVVYRDAESDRFAVLVRRRDGHFDLIEA